MERQQVVDTILGAALKKGQEEVSSLIGQPVEFSDTQVATLSRETLFENLQDPLVLAELTVEGDQQGLAYLILNVADALSLGGALIMLPEEELQDRISKGEFSGDEADAYGEIVNIMAGVVAGLFDEHFPEKLRFVKAGQQVVNPVDITNTGNNPLPAGPLCISKGAGSLKGQPFSGPIQIVVPGALLGLAENAEAPPGNGTDVAASENKEENAPEAGPETTSATNVDQTEVSDAATAGDSPDRASSGEDEAPSAQGNNPASSVSEEKLIKLLRIIQARTREEIGGFLGHSFDIKNEKFRVSSREDLFSGLDGPQVLAKLRAEGDREGEGFLISGLSAAIHLGGTLIMLPDSELKERLSSGEFGAEDADAFGEIVNIVSGIYTSVFNEGYPGALRFVKTEQELIDPVAIKAQGEFPVADTEYFVATGDAVLDAQELGQIAVALPSDVLGLEKSGLPADQKVEAEEGQAETGAEKGTEVQSEPPGTKGATAHSVPSSESDSEAAGATPSLSEDASSKQPMILVCSDSKEQAEIFINAIQGLDCVARYQDVTKNVAGLGPETCGVFLVMDNVGEQGIAAAIKINATVRGRMPLIAAGPNWTKSMVLRAIKYGINDILVTPASEAQIKEKVKLTLVA